MAEAAVVLYWDTSALLSCLFMDSHSAIAQKWAAIEGHHLLSSLAHAEACAVITRMTREGMVDEADANAARAAMQNGWWRLFIPELFIFRLFAAASIYESNFPSQRG